MATQAIGSGASAGRRDLMAVVDAHDGQNLPCSWAARMSAGRGKADGHPPVQRIRRQQVVQRDQHRDVGRCVRRGCSGPKRCAMPVAMASRNAKSLDNTSAACGRRWGSLEQPRFAFADLQFTALRSPNLRPTRSASINTLACTTVNRARRAMRRLRLLSFIAPFSRDTSAVVSNIEPLNKRAGHGRRPEFTILTPHRFSV